MLFEAEGQVGHAPVSAVRVIAERMAEALSLRPAQIELNHYALQRGRIVQTHPITLRGRFAVRLAHKGEDETGVNRTGLVRTAFNSPFKPFVLASTSVGQEGLDFHPTATASSTGTCQAILLTWGSAKAASTVTRTMRSG